MHRAPTVLAMDCVLAGAETHRGRPLNWVVRALMEEMAPMLAAVEAIWRWIEANLSTAISAGAGTFAGAFLAFRFERNYKEHKDQTASLLAGKKAQFALASQISLLKNLRKNYLVTHKSDPDRALMMTPITIHSRPGSIDLDSLAFFLDDEGAEVLGNLVTADQRFGSALGTLEQRNRVHEQAQRVLASTSPPVLDKATFAILTNLTDALYAGVDDAISTHEQEQERLTKYLQRRFPKGKVLSVEYKY